MREPVGLPAFLTNPVRTPLPTDIDEAPAPKVVESAEAEVRPRRRAVRRPRQDEAEADGNVAVETPKAETPAE
ncbi:MAG: hypothetical protein K0S56_3727 [Microvirga sp.]|nr:hypothetical protein [Microvirga sp.]